MIYHEKRLIHVHPPKTGGQAVQEALGVPASEGVVDGVWRHDSLHTMWDLCPESKGYTVAVSVREPVERLVSFYFYVLLDRERHNDPVKVWLQRWPSCETWLGNADFDEVLRMGRECPREKDRFMLRPMTWYMCGEKADVVWRLDQVGWLLPRVNVGSRPDVDMRVMRRAAGRNGSLVEWLAQDEALWRLYV